MKLAALAFLFILALALLAGCQTQNTDKLIGRYLEARYYESLWCGESVVAMPGDAERAAAYAARTHLECR